MKTLTTAQTLLREIDTLQQQYLSSYSVNDDIKALQGVERCIELKMKIYGITGKEPLMENETNPEIVIDLAKLSSPTLKEIMQASSTNTKTK